MNAPCRSIATLTVIVGVMASVGIAPAGARGYWENCGPAASYQETTVLAHSVSCEKAKKIIRKSWRVGQRQGETETINVNRFHCQIRPTADRMVSCRHNSQRILGPLPS